MYRDHTPAHRTAGSILTAPAMHSKALVSGCHNPHFYHPGGILCCLLHLSPAMAVIFLCRGGTEGLWLCSVHAGARAVGYLQDHARAGQCRPCSSPAKEPETTVNISWHLQSITSTCLETPSAVHLESIKTSLALVLLDISIQVNPGRGTLHSAPLKCKLILLHLGPTTLAYTDKDTLTRQYI